MLCPSSFFPTHLILPLSLLFRPPPPPPPACVEGLQTDITDNESKSTDTKVCLKCVYLCACVHVHDSVFASVKRNARLEGESISIFAIYFCTIAGCSTVFETENDRQNERAGRERGQRVEKGLLILLCCWGRIYLQGKSGNMNAPEIQAGLSF